MSSDASLAGHGVPPAGTNNQSSTNIGATPAPPAQEKVPFYKRRKFIICQAIFIPLGIALLFILLFPVVTAIAQLVVNKSHLVVDVAQISSPGNSSFELSMNGIVTNTGFIPAKIEFTRPIDVTWVRNVSGDGNTKRAEGEEEVPIGAMNFTDALQAHNKRASINQTTTLLVTNEAVFGDFAKAMITQKTFKWRLRSDNLRVQASKFPVSHGIKFDKTLELNGFNSFKDGVRLKSFELPSDNPAGGINFVAVTELNNTSPFSLNLGTVVFDLFYEGQFLGRGTGKDTIIKPGLNDVALEGRLVPGNSTSDLANLSKLFTSYLNAESVPVIAKGVSTLQPDGSAISWLSSGITALELTVPFVAPNGEAISPIKKVDIGSFDLHFQEGSTQWSPGIESNSVRAALELPFGFSVSIGEIQNEFNISKDANPVAGLSTPLGASKSNISVLSSTMTSGTIDITIANSNLSCPEPLHSAFSTFNSLLTSTEEVPFQLIGYSRAIANISVGQINLDKIKVNVTTSLKGLQGLKGRTIIQSVDVTGGTKDGVELAINVTIDNPSNLRLATGDLNLQLYRNQALLGTTLLPNLELKMGNNSLVATSVFAANDSPEGLQTLNDFVAKKDVPLRIAGYDSSTKIGPLVEAFKTLNIDVTLPGLKTNLLNTAALKILPTTGKTNNIAHVSVKMNNPFSAALKITRIQSEVSAYGIPLGTIDTTTGFSTTPHADTTSPQLDLDMNLAPEAVFTVTRALAVDAGLDVGPLDGIVQLGGYSYLKTTGPPVRRLLKRDNIFTGFDLPKFVHTSFAKLKSDVKLKTDVTIGDYATTLEFSQLAVPTQTDESLDLILPILARPIVQKIVSASALGIQTVLITDPAQNSFGAELKGSITNAGPFDASIAFPQGLTVSWSGSPLGNIKMGDVKIVGDVGGDISSKSLFQVADVRHLTDFTKNLITTENFDWEIAGQNLSVSALGIKVPEIALDTKRVTLKGFNGLKDGVKIKTFDLPSNDPTGGIHLTLEATTFNPSQVGVALESIGFETFVGNVMIAPVGSKGPITLAPQKETALSLVGRLVPQNNDAGLSTVSDVFNNFVHGKDSSVVVHGASTKPSAATWLNEGIKALKVATVLPNRGPLNIIKSIDLRELQLLFTQSTAYAPLSSSKSTDAAFTLPFGFPLDISALEQTITTSYSGKEFAQLIIPKSPSKTDVQNRIIHLSFNDVPFSVFGDSHGVFNDFVAATTMKKSQTLGLSGSANADAKTAVGLLSLKGISFKVDSTIAGLQGLNARPVSVANLDVNHGFSDYLLIKVDSAIFNPSNLTIGTDDVSFGLSYKDQTIGSVVMNDLMIKPGNASYPTDVHFSPKGGAVASGRQLLENFLQGVDVDTTIAGSTDSTPIGSLKSALSQISLSPVKIPAMHDTLIKSASLTFPLDIVQSGIAQTKFTLANPFTASINLLRIGATAKYAGILLGTIDNIDISSNPIHADGHSNITSPSLPMKYNLDPISIIKFLSLAAQEKSVNLGPLVSLFQFVLEHPDFHPPVTTTVDTKTPTCVSGNQFDVAGAILKTLADLKVDLNVDSGVKLDDYATDLSFLQKAVPAVTDKTALFLIGAVAGPVAQALVDGSILKFDSAIITNITDDGFDLKLKGSLTNVGPLDALITFTEPLTVTWQGHNIGEIELPPVCAAANTGVPKYKTKAHFRITDRAQFIQFVIFLLHNGEFTWTVSTSKLRLNALGTVFDTVSLKKDVTFKAFNNLPGVTISNFQLPSDDPAGGIHIETDSLIPSSAQIGIELGTVTFESEFEGTTVGPLSAQHLVLAPSSVTKSHLSGRMVPQSGADLDKIGVLFSNFLAGKNQTLNVKGESVQPDGADGPVEWLSTAFKTLTLEVTLPGQKFDIIQAIELHDLDVTIEQQDQAFAPPTTSKQTLAKYKNPFGFSLQVIESGQEITLASSGVDIAQLVLDKEPADGGVSTGNVVDLHISWENVPLRSLNNPAFAAMLAGATNKDELELTLKGVADVTARTKIGDVPISGIPFDVPSSLNGINAFGHTAVLSGVSVAGSGGVGGSEYIVSPLTTTLDNPSEISLHTTISSLPVFYENTMIGRAEITPFDLAVGTKDYRTEFHYKPTDANNTIAQSFLTRFITTGDSIPLVIKGDSDSTPFPSLQQAFSLIQIATSIGGLNKPTFITSIEVFITLDSLVTDLVSVEFKVANPLDTSITLSFVQSDSGVNGDIYAHFDQAFDGFTVQPGQTASSGKFPNVLLTKGALASLDIIPLGYLDTFTAATTIVGGGYTIPWLHLNQDHVPTTYTLDLGFSASSPAALKAKAKQIIQGTTSSSSSQEKTLSVTDARTTSSTKTTDSPSPTRDSDAKATEVDADPTESASAPESSP